MSFRSQVLIAILVVTVLEIAAFAFIMSGDLDDRRITLFGTILAALTPTVATLFILLRAGEKADETSEKVDAVHHNMLNGALRKNVKTAIAEDRHDLRDRETAEIARFYKSASPELRKEMRQMSLADIRTLMQSGIHEVSTDPPAELLELGEDRPTGRSRRRTSGRPETEKPGERPE